MNDTYNIIVKGDYVKEKKQTINVFAGGKAYFGSEQMMTDDASDGDENATVKAIKDAVDAVMAAKDENDERVFTHQSQWSGVWLILHDLGRYKGTDSGFGDYLLSLGIVPKEPLHLTDVELFKDFGKRRPQSFASWNPDGSIREKRVYEVARLFKEEIEKRLP